MDGAPLSWIWGSGLSIYSLNDTHRSMSSLDTSLDDPGKDPRFRKIAKAVLWSRRFILFYNLILLGILLVFTISHWTEKVTWARRRRRRALETRKNNVDGTEIRNVEESGDEAWSSSSSTIEGTATPPDAIKQAREDDERTPLIARQKNRRRTSRKICDRFQSWMMYQPRPIPIINKTLPQNNVSLAILAFIALNLFFTAYHLPFSAMYLFAWADRAGLVFVANLPLLYLLAAKNQPIKLLTGHSYESLNIVHRRLGELMCFEAFLHFAGMMGVWYFLLQHIGFTLIRFLTTKLILLGLIAFVAYEAIYFTSLGSFRKRWYEAFLVLHVLLQAAGLVLLWFHHHTTRPYTGISLGIFLADRFLFRLGFKTSSFPATLTILPDNETILVSTNWTIPPLSPFPFSLLQRSIRHGWNPTSHIFISIPSLRSSPIFQAHPFTIYSAAPSRSATDPTAQHAWLSLLIRPQRGFTRALTTYAHTHPQARIRLDGPYGSSHAEELLEASDTSIVVAGGSGIAVAYPLLYALLSPSATSSALESGMAMPRRNVKLLWIIHSQNHRTWLEESKVDELRGWGLDVVVEGPTAQVGRPDVEASLTKWVRPGGEELDERTGIVVSGPDGLVRDVRNVGAKLRGEGRRVGVQVEKFGW